MEHPYADISDSERLERDWQAEQRAEARFLRETCADWQIAPTTDQVERANLSSPAANLSSRPVHCKQLNLFEVQQ